jgi:hypothetical protein
MRIAGSVQARKKFPPIKQTEIQIAAACSRMLASFCARESRSVTDDAYQRAPRAGRTPRSLSAHERVWDERPMGTMVVDA